METKNSRCRSRPTTWHYIAISNRQVDKHCRKLDEDLKRFNEEQIIAAQRQTAAIKKRKKDMEQSKTGILGSL